jgi:predicted PurR-regulated permease PerM
VKRHAAWAVPAAALLLLLLACYFLYDSLFPIFLGFGLAYAFGPLIDWLERKGLSREAAAIALLAGTAAAAVLALALLIPPLLSEARDLAAHFPAYSAAAIERSTELAARLNIPLPHGKEELLMRLSAKLGQVPLGAFSAAGFFAGRFFSGAVGLLLGVLNLLVVPVVFFYFLRDMALYRASFLEHFPPSRRKAVEERLGEADRVFSGYLRGQMSVALILAVLYAAGLSLAGIRFGAIIGVLSGLLNIIPYVGVLTGLVLSSTIAVVDFNGWGPLLAVPVVFGVCQLLEGFVITPRVVGDKVGLSPLETLIALILGGEVAGFLGLILAIPTAGCIKVWGAHALKAWRESDVYGQG